MKPGDKPIQASAKKLGYRVCPDPACWHYLTPKKATREKAPIPVAATMPEEKPPELIA